MTIYDTIAKYESDSGEKVSLLLLCGDFQALRSEHDFAAIASPPKYHQLGTFHEYYSGSRVAPILTIVIGGNHEASNYMWELYHGGWLAPNIYYLGAAGSVMVDGLRISGASGIFKRHNYWKGMLNDGWSCPSRVACYSAALQHAWCTVHPGVEPGRFAAPPRRQKVCAHHSAPRRFDPPSVFT